MKALSIKQVPAGFSIRIRVGGKMSGVGGGEGIPPSQRHDFRVGVQGHAPPGRFLYFGPLKMHFYILGQIHV